MRVVLSGLCGSVMMITTVFLGCGGSGGGSSPPPGTAPDASTDSGMSVHSHPGTGTESDASTDAPVQDASPAASDASDAGPEYAAPHPPLPQVMKGDGIVLDKSKVIPVFYPGYDFTARMTDFLGKLGGTSYWQQTTSEYGVQSITMGTPIMLTTPAPATIDDADIQTWLLNQLDGTHPEFGNPDDHTIFAILFPSTTTVTFAHDPKQASCVAFGGYHSNIDVTGVSVPYTVVPECSNFHNLAPEDMVTLAESHEILETVTDPFGANQYARTDSAAYSFPDMQDFPLAVMYGGGEVGDMCEHDPAAAFKADFGYVVQRSWSNAAAAADQDPCVPAGPTPFFAAAPVMNFPIAPFPREPTFVTTGLYIPVGGSETIEVDLFSLAPTSGPWTLSAQDDQQAQKLPPNLSFAFDKATGQNGDKVKLTITVNKGGQSYKEFFEVVSQLGDRKTFWAGMIDSTPPP